jgi:hypothetical protein
MKTYKVQLTNRITANTLSDAMKQFMAIIHYWQRFEITDIPYDVLTVEEIKYED